MRTTRMLHLAGMVAVGFAGYWVASTVGLRALQLAVEPIAVETNGIGGLVTSAKGPEAGVWVIAETSELPTKFVKIVVTDDRGRYLIPDLPQASYSVWVRGYGLVDSPKVQSTPGKTVNLTAVVAPNARGGRILPGHLLVFPGSGTGKKRVPWYRTQWQWHFAEHEESGPVVTADENG